MELCYPYFLEILASLQNVGSSKDTPTSVLLDVNIISHPGAVSLPLLLFLLALFIVVVAVALVPFVVLPLCPILPPHVEIVLVPQVGIVVVVALLLLQIWAAMSAIWWLATVGRGGGGC